VATALIPVEIRKRVDSWKTEVSQRRAITPHDPVADTFAYCAKDLEETIKLVEKSTPTFTTRQFAQLKGVRDGTVRKWIDAGELEAHKNGAGDWEIPRGAVRTRKKRKARA
jgi:excisionase family DNA binding protein